MRVWGGRDCAVGRAGLHDEEAWRRKTEEQQREATALALTQNGFWLSRGINSAIRCERNPTT